MLAVSGLYDYLENFAFCPAGREICLYGDPAYPLRIHVQAPFRVGVLTGQMEIFIEKMSAVRASVEWLVFYSHTFTFMLSSNKVWEKRLISGLSQAGTAWLRKSSRYDSRDFWAGLGGPSTSSRLR